MSGMTPHRYRHLLGLDTKALIHPWVDFFAVGGASLLFFAIGMMIIPVGTNPYMGQMAMLAGTLSFVVNYPHFAFSYQLMYRDYWKDAFTDKHPVPLRLRYLFAGLVMPTALIAYLGWAVYHADSRLLGYSVNLLIFTLGWHYVKQGYGCLIVLSLYRGCYFSHYEKWILRGNILIVWLTAWAIQNTLPTLNYFHGIPYTAAGLTPMVGQCARYVMTVSSVLAAGVLLKKLFLDRQPLSINGIVGYLCASYLWIYMVHVSYLLIYFVPLFHSLQYLPFVYRYKINELRHKEQAVKQFVLFMGVGIVMGGLAMHSIPVWIDMQRVNGTQDVTLVSLTPQLAMFLALVFINLHHYFIDNVVWRGDNRETKRWLFDPARA